MFISHLGSSLCIFSRLRRPLLIRLGLAPIRAALPLLRPPPPSAPPTLRGPYRKKRIANCSSPNPVMMFTPVPPAPCLLFDIIGGNFPDANCSGNSRGIFQILPPNRDVSFKPAYNTQYFHISK
ncbi:unnamed protein product, partial [Nesidiocoris tenuis]